MKPDKIGQFNVIGNVTFGANVEVGNFCVLHDGVEIGEGTVVKDYVELRPGTVIGKHCYIDSRVSSSGNCVVEDHVTVRYDSILARGVHIGQHSYICPRVMTNNLDKDGVQIGGARLGQHCFIGTNAVLQHGIVLADRVIVGSMSFVNSDCESGGVYIGTPARMIKKRNG